MSIWDAKETYRRWWRGKRCRLAYSRGPFKLVDDVEVHGPPSFVYGFAKLKYADGTTENVAPVDAFRSRKCDVEVHPDDIPTKKQATRNVADATRNVANHKLRFAKGINRDKS